MSAENAEAPVGGGSLADRITKPDSETTGTNEIRPRR